MKLFIVFAAVIALSYAEECDMLSRLMVKQQWADLYTTGKDRILFNTHVWEKFFHMMPEAREKFDRVNGKNIYSGAFRAHMSRVNAGLDMVFSLLDDQAVYEAQIQHLKDQHKELGIGIEYFDKFGEALIEVAAEHETMCFHFQCWTDCYHMVAQGIAG